MKTLLLLLVSLLLIHPVPSSASPAAQSRSYENGAASLLTAEYERALETAMEIAIALLPERQALALKEHLAAQPARPELLSVREAILTAYAVLQREKGLSDLDIAQLYADVFLDEEDPEQPLWLVYFNSAMPGLSETVFHGVALDAGTGSLVRTWDMADVPG